MYSAQLLLIAYAALISSVPGTHAYQARSLNSVLNQRQYSGPSQDLVVDLGYERYQGVSKATTGLNEWFGYLVEICNAHLDYWLITS